MRLRRLAMVLATSAVALALPGSVLAAAPPGALDQSHECAAAGCNSVGDLNGGTGPNAMYPYWYSQNGNQGETVGLGQTFTAGLSGTLTGVELFLNGLDATTPAALTVQIVSTTGGKPSGTVLASTTVASSAWTATPGWVTATFATPPTVAAGTMYAITLPELPQQGIAPWLVWGLDATATAAYPDYAGGEAYASVAGSWASLSSALTDGGPGTADLAFRTYVQAAAPSPSPSASLSPSPSPSPASSIAAVTPPPTDQGASTTSGGGAAPAVILMLAVIGIGALAARPRSRSRRA